MWTLAASLAFSIQPYLATEQGALDWRIAPDLSGAESPNILSELEFERVYSQQLGLDGHITAEWRGPWQMYLEGTAAYAKVDRGTTVDSDYVGDNRTGLYSRSRSNIVGDGGLLLRGGLGLSYKLASGRQRLLAVLGVYRHEQALNFRRGRQLVADPNVYSASDIGEINRQLQGELDTDYRTEWQGSYFSLGYRWDSARWRHEWRLNYYRGRYYGEGHWNLRDDLQQPRSFSHFVNSSGWELHWDIHYRLSDRWSAFGGFSRRQWDSDAGVSVSFLSNGGLNATRFSGVSWVVSQSRLGLSYRW